MKKTDETIINALRNNGRVRLTELSRKTNLPVSTIHERLKRYTREGLIHPNATLCFPKLGFTSIAHILLAVAPKDKDALFNYLKTHPHVNNLYKINNGWSLIMEAIFTNMYELETFIESIETKYNITKKEIHYTLDEIKREAFFT